ncbi:hypothetical protein [Haloplanus rubicundus]|nr:hypothetical protein [Haloplanus rubicundus]
MALVSLDSHPNQPKPSAFDAVERLLHLTERRGTGLVASTVVEVVAAG